MSDTPQGPGWWQASDGKYYPPGTPPPPEKKKSGCLKWGLIGLGVLVLLMIIGAAAGGGDDTDTASSSPGAVTDETTPPSTAGGIADDDRSSNSGDHPAIEDVHLKTCAEGEFGPEVTVDITNHSSKRSNYMIEVNLIDANGTKVGSATGFENNIDPGQAAVGDLLASSSGDFAKCRLVDVTRMASN